MHAERAEVPNQGAARDIVSYVAEFGLSLAELRAEQVAMFVAARNSGALIEGLEVEIASKASQAEASNLMEQATENVVELTAYQNVYLDSRTPADEMDVSVIRSVEDLPRVFPTQWLLEETVPDLFYAKLAGQELLVPEWQRPTEEARDAESETQERILVEEPSAARSTRPHAYVLLDTSRSMKDRDRRGTVARGLALAFLFHGYRERARLALRPFTAKLGELSSGSGQEDLRTIARRTINLPNAGQTRIQTALEQAVDDIRQAGPCRRASIMLISDGISRITKKPLADEKLHTFLIGDLLENSRTAGTIRTLKEWSSTFHRVWTNRFAEILAPQLADIEAAGLVLERMLDELGDDPSPEKAAELDRLWESLSALVEQFQTSWGKRAELPAEVQALKALLESARQRLARCSKAARGAADEQAAAKGHSFGFELFAASGPGDSGDTAGLWERLKQLLLRTWRWAWGRLRRR